MRVHWAAQLLGLLLCAIPLGAEGPAPALSHRWVFLPQNLLLDPEVAAVKGILTRARAAGYNGAVLHDTKLCALDLLGGNRERYLRNLEEVRRTAAGLGLTLVSSLANPGSATPLLAHAPDLAEGIPVRDVPYRVRRNLALPETAPGPQLANPGFDQGEGNRLQGFLAQDGAGTGSFLDPLVRRSGRASLRMERFGEVNPPHAMVRVAQKVPLQPWRQYRLSAWIRTEGVDRPGAIQMLVKGSDGRELAWADTRARKDQPWTLAETIFPSLDQTEATLYFGVWGAHQGKVWWSDASLEDAGLVNVIRRPACPFLVRGEGGRSYVEGVDYQVFQDSFLGSQPYAGAFGIAQGSPPLVLTPGSRIRDGERLLLSGYVAKVIGAGQVAACLGEDSFFDLIAGEVESQATLLHPAGFLLGHDEIRVIGQDPPCRGEAPGKLLARNIRRCADIVRKKSPKALVCVWSDMFSPTQNAHGGYYLAAGDLTGSWEGLSGDMLILNWDWANPRQGAAFFAGLGCGQVLAGYYDRDPGFIREWLNQVRGIPGILGVMYTTFEDRYEDLEAFAQAAWGPPISAAR
ncbi:MAG TPA: hypothetical protein VK188_18665 [Holophaga sp.]|nr:hypothetical protein [Holophaga sp.]